MRCPAEAAREKVLTIQPPIRMGIASSPISSMKAARSPADRRPLATSLPPTSRITPVAAVNIRVMREPWEANSLAAE